MTTPIRYQYEIGGTLDAITVDSTNSNALRVRKNSAGAIVFNVDTSSDIVDVTGNITVSGTVDGIDIATQDAKLVDLHDTIGLSALTSAEVDQLENIGSVTISNTQWGYLGATDQAIATTDSTTFNGVTLSGDKSGTPSATGSYLDYNASTFTDNATAASGTATLAAFNSFGAPTLAATNVSVTTTTAATVYIADAPTAGTNQTITNAYSLWVDAGISRFDNQIQITGSPGSIGNSDITNGYLFIGTSSNGIGIDNNEIYRKGSGSFILGTIDAGTALSLRTNGAARMNITDSSVNSITILPTTTETYDLGSASLEWNNIYSQNTVTVSDLTKKKNIKDDILGLDFINDLNPKEYRYITTNNKGHGLLAQDVEELLLKTVGNSEGIVSCKVNEDGSKTDYGLNYTQLIGPIINAIKELKLQNDYLHQLINAIKKS